MNISDLEIKPCFKVVKLNQTDSFEHWLEGKGYEGKIYGIFIYDSNQVTHCCEVTPSYCLENLGHVFEWGDRSIDEIARDCKLTEEEIEGVEHQTDDTVSYFHCTGIDRLPDDINQVYEDYSVGDTSLDYEQTYDEAYQAAIASYFGDPVW